MYEAGKGDLKMSQDKNVIIAIKSSGQRQRANYWDKSWNGAFL